MRRLSIQSLKMLLRDAIRQNRIISVPDDGLISKSLRRYLLNSVEISLNSDGRFLSIDVADENISFPEHATDLRVVDTFEPRMQTQQCGIEEKVYGSGNSLLILSCQFLSDEARKTVNAVPWTLVFIDSDRTGDFQTTYGLREIMRRKGNRDDILSFLEERFPSITDAEKEDWATKVLSAPPRLGYLTLSSMPIATARVSRVFDMVMNMSRSRGDGIELLYSIHDDPPVAAADGFAAISAGI